MGEIDISTTGGWYAWEDFKLPNLVIEEARQAVLRLEFVGGDFNLNYVEFIESDHLGDSDGDGAVDLTEFAFGSDPVSKRVYQCFRLDSIIRAIAARLCRW